MTYLWNTTSKTKKKFMKSGISWVWQQTPIILALGRLRQEDCQFEAEVEEEKLTPVTLTTWEIRRITI
jgi:hypothetical protein